MPVGEPDEAQEHLLMVCQTVPEQLLVLTVCLADLPFNSVSIDSVLEPLLGDTDQDLYRCVAFTTFDGLIYGSEGEGRDRLAAAVSKSASISRLLTIRSRFLKVGAAAIVLTLFLEEIVQEGARHRGVFL